MAYKKINLDIPEVESREQRLGTIIAWDGKASELSEQSSYERRGCSGKGKQCRLCEVNHLLKDQYAANKWLNVRQEM